MIVGGRGTLIGPVVGCIAIQWLTAFLGSAQLSRASLAQILGPTVADALSSVLGIADFSNTNLVLGAVLLAFVLLVPKGVMPTLLNLARRVVARRRPAAELVADKAEGTT